MSRPKLSYPPALRYRDFRLFWSGLFVSVIGSQMQLIAINWHIFNLLRGQTYTAEILGRSIELSAQALGLGTLGLVRVIPIILFALFGGMLADTRNRRTLLLFTEGFDVVIAAILAYLTLTGQATVLHIYIITAMLAAMNALEGPSRQSLVPHLVPAEHFANAISVQTLMITVAAVIGPALAGLVVGYFNVGYVYAINAVSFLGVVVSLLLMSYRGHVAAKSTGLGFAALAEGLRFVFRTPIISSTMLLDFIATFFSSARTMLPIIASDILGVGAVGYGWLAAADSVGAALAGGRLSVRAEQLRRQGPLLLGCVIIYGAATALLGVSTSFALSFVALMIVGASDAVSMVIRGTVRQLMTPDELRGRMTSVNMMFFMGGPQLGELEAGLVAAAFGVPFAVVTGGVATVALTILIAWKYPMLRRFDSPVLEVAV
ncbi:MAG: MFS transporter [Anaerolineae bacterium]|nr:MAG: MFS transporter [Anaerolineae bacterium]